MPRNTVNTTRSLAVAGLTAVLTLGGGVAMSQPAAEAASDQRACWNAWQRHLKNDRYLFLKKNKTTCKLKVKVDDPRTTYNDQKIPAGWRVWDGGVQLGKGRYSARNSYTVVVPDWR